MASHPYRRKADNTPKSFRRVQGNATQPGASILVVTEGLNTEPVYFESIRRVLATRILELVTYGAGRGDPRKLAEVALEKRDERRRMAKKGKLSLHQLEDFDEVWIVFDADVLSLQKLNEGLAYSKINGIRCALSEPCFEYWLLLHNRDHYTTANMDRCANVIPYLQRAFGWQHYDKSLKESRTLIEPLVTREHLVTAIKAAERVRYHHKEAGTAFPHNPSTDIDRLIGAINASLPPSRKIH